MDPLVQYASSSDGVSIAYWTLGEGPALVVPPLLAASHLELEWQIPSRRAAYEHLAEGARVVRYDARGSGMSQRDVLDFSLDAAFRDLEAVTGRLGLERFAVLGLPAAGDIPFALPARFPERVTHCIYWEGHGSDERDPRRVSQTAAIEPVVARDWDLYVKIRARLIAGWDGQPTASLLEDLLRETLTPQSVHLADEAIARSDPAPYLAAIQAPTLIFYRVGVRQREASARLYASRIPDARLVAVRERSMGPLPNESGIAAMHDFLRPGGVRHGYGRREPPGQAVRVILFTDLERHTAMMQRLGDERGRAVLREHENITREALDAYGGAEVKTMGDSFMASFASATRALECAMAIQKAFSARNETAEEPLRVRVGVSAGEPIAEEEDLFGSSVIIASRIAGQAKGGEIIVANVVRELAAGKGFLFADRGEVPLRGFEDPVRLFELKWEQTG